MPLHHGLRAAAGASPADPYFSSTSLLLLGNGTNGGQNNTFVDSSTNNFTITRNGNTTQGSFSPFSAPDGRWSNYFDGNGDYLRPPSDTALNIGNGNFTIEAWVYVTSSSEPYQHIFKQGPAGGLTNNIFMLNFDTGVPGKIGSADSTGTGSEKSGVYINRWHHVAVVRNGTSTTVYLDGVAGNTATFDPGFTTNQTSTIGYDNGNAPPRYFNGYISNFRILKNTALYTANFTPSTSPLTAITNTSLLTCQSNRFKDNSSNAFAITPSGNAAVTSFSPFAPLAEYSASSNGGSGYFDGSGDKLTIPVNQAPLLLGSSDFSFECWIYWTQSISRAIFYIAQNDAATATGSSYMFSVANSSSTSDFWIGSSYYGVTCPIPNLNSWAHIAFSRTGGTLSSFLNGNRIGTRSDLGTGSINNGSTAYPQTIGTNSDGSSAFQGYISGMRLIKGSGGYDATQSTIAIPSAVPSAITNTSLLLNFTNASIIDSTAKNDLETVGDAQVSTSVKKFGTGSLKFDGAGDYLSIPDSSLFDIGSGDFTIECWINFTAITSSTNVSTFAGQWRSSSLSLGWLFYLYNISGTCGVYLSYSTTGTNQFNLSVNLPSNPSIGTWYHYAVCRSGSNLRFFVDGTQIGATQTLSATIFNSVAPIWIAAQNNGSPDFQLNGYLDDFRLTKYARYVSNFTPPSAQLPAR